jgi:hypothetical protein
MTESLVKNIILKSEREPYQSLRRTFSLVESDDWDEARLFWLITHEKVGRQATNSHNIFGSVDENLLRFIRRTGQYYQTKAICSRPNCPTRERTFRAADIAIE